MLNNKSKKGDVPVMVLVIGVVLVCTLALLSFNGAYNNIIKSFSDIESVERIVAQGELYDFYSDNSISQNVIKIKACAKYENLDCHAALAMTTLVNN